MTKPFIIGFSGRKGSGKNTCADVLTERIYETHDGQNIPRVKLVRTYAFADPMKRVCQQFFGLTPEQCYGENSQKNTPSIVHWGNFPAQVGIDRPERYMTGRELLQYFGTEVLRRMDTQAHVRALLWMINDENPLYAFVTDVRFPNEVAAVQENGGKVIRLTRCLYPDDNHESETALDPENYDWNNFDYILDNKNIGLVEQKILLLTLATQWGIIR